MICKLHKIKRNYVIFIKLYNAKSVNKLLKSPAELLTTAEESSHLAHVDRT